MLENALAGISTHYGVKKETPSKKDERGPEGGFGVPG
jgi:hypothetical protein